MDSMCLTIIDPVASWFGMLESPNKYVTYVLDKDKEKCNEIMIDKSSAYIVYLFNKPHLSHYQQAVSVVYDNGSKFRVFFENLCEYFQLKHKPTTIKNP